AHAPRVLPREHPRRGAVITASSGAGRPWWSPARRFRRASSRRRTTCSPPASRIEDISQALMPMLRHPDALRKGQEVTAQRHVLADVDAAADDAAEVVAQLGLGFEDDVDHVVDRGGSRLVLLPGGVREPPGDAQVLLQAA